MNGTGPFMVDNYIQGNSLSFKKNPGYWDSETIGGAPYKLPFVDGITYRFIKDEATMLTALRTAKVDVLESIRWSAAEELKKNAPKLQWNKFLAMGGLFQVPGGTAGFQVGCLDTRGGGEPAWTLLPPVMDDVRCRQFIDGIVAIAHTEGGGTGEPNNSGGIENYAGLSTQTAVAGSLDKMMGSKAGTGEATTTIAALTATTTAMQRLTPIVRRPSETSAAPTSSAAPRACGRAISSAASITEQPLPLRPNHRPSIVAPSGGRAPVFKNRSAVVLINDGSETCHCTRYFMMTVLSEVGC